MSVDEILNWLDQSPDNKNDWLQSGLKLACDYLDMETGIVSKTTTDSYAIQAVYSRMGDIFSPGMKFELQNTYCEAVVKNKKVVTYKQVGSIPEMILHPVYIAVQLESYIGIPLYNKQNQVIGTLNFSSHKIKHDDFKQENIELLIKMSEKIQQVFNL